MSYVNNVFDVNQKGTPLLFVGDMKIVYTFRSESSESTVSNVSQDVAKTNELVGLLNRTLKLNGSKLHLFRTHFKPISEYCCLVCSKMRHCDRVAIENIQDAFTKQLFGYSTSLNYVECSESLKSDPLWLTHKSKSDTSTILL